MSSHHRDEAQVATVRVPSLATSWDQSNARGEMALFPQSRWWGALEGLLQPQERVWAGPLVLIVQLVLWDPFWPTPVLK